MGGDGGSGFGFPFGDFGGGSRGGSSSFNFGGSRSGSQFGGSQFGGSQFGGFPGGFGSQFTRGQGQGQQKKPKK